jgi:hypothetical protein
VPTAEDLNFIRLGYVPSKTNAARAKDAPFLIEFYERPKIERLSAACFLAERIAAVVAGMCHVVVLQPTFSGLIANGAIDRMMKQKKLHGIPDCFVNALGVGADFHVVGHGGCACRHELWCALDLHETHAATAFNTDVGMVAISRNLNADIIRHLDYCSSLFGLVHLAVDRDFQHKQFRLA